MTQYYRFCHSIYRARSRTSGYKCEMSIRSVVTYSCVRTRINPQRSIWCNRSKSRNTCKKCCHRDGYAYQARTRWGWIWDIVLCLVSRSCRRSTLSNYHTWDREWDTYSHFWGKVSHRCHNTMELSCHALGVGMYPATPRRQYCCLEDIQGGHPHRQAHRWYRRED